MTTTSTANLARPSHKSPTCPRCNSQQIDTKDVARKAGAGIGVIAGAYAGASSAIAGAEAGALLGSVAGPLGLAIGSVFGALTGAIVGATAGCVAGAQIGYVLDETALLNYRCADCEFTFAHH